MASDALHRYDLNNGAHLGNLTAVDSFPEQIAEAGNGNVLVANFSGAEDGILEYTAAGAFVGRYDPSAAYRGVYELPNGHLLITAGGGVLEIDRSGTVIETKISGVDAQYIELVQLSAVPLAPPGCSAATATLANTTPVTVPDNMTVTSTLAVSGVAPYLWDVNVTTSISHTISSDVDITLTSPAGTAVTLSSGNGNGYGGVFLGTAWDDDAGEVTLPGPVTDHTFSEGLVATPLAPEEALGAFLGEDPNGLWTLTVADTTANGADGRLDAWALEITAMPFAATTAATAQASSAPVVIADGASVTATLVVSDTGRFLADVNLTTSLTHPASGDLSVTLTSPDGTVTTISTNNGGDMADIFAGTLWDDDAGDTNPPGPVTDNVLADGVVETTLVPEEALGAFIGEDPNGAWTLAISDGLVNGQAGSLAAWSLALTTALCAPQLAVEPAALSSAQGPDTVVTKTLLIHNTGTAELTWTIEEAPTSPAIPRFAKSRYMTPVQRFVKSLSGPLADGGRRPAPAREADERPVARGSAPAGPFVADGGFEAGTPNPFWHEASLNFGTPICNADCADPQFGFGPHSGEWWAWFGGVAGAAEQGSVDQDVTLPAGSARLSFWLQIPVANTTGSLAVSLDGAVVFTATEADQAAYATYQEVAVDISDFADGGTHTLKFEGITDDGSGALNFFVDDVAITTGCAAPHDIAWLTAAPASGATPPGGSTAVTVTFDAAGLAGPHSGLLCLHSNDAGQALIEIPVSLMVNLYRSYLPVLGR
jgi:subtilisin-like proprotein convertase family protein